MTSIHPKQLDVGDIFSEDPYPEMYEVVQKTKHGVIGKDTESGERCEFLSPTRSAYAPDIVLHKRG